MANEQSVAKQVGFLADLPDQSSNSQRFLGWAVFARKRESSARHQRVSGFFQILDAAHEYRALYLRQPIDK
jgi:hypothetical protein